MWHGNLFPWNAAILASEDSNECCKPSEKPIGTSLSPATWICPVQTVTQWFCLWLCRSPKNGFVWGSSRCNPSPGETSLRIPQASPHFSSLLSGSVGTRCCRYLLPHGSPWAYSCGTSLAWLSSWPQAGFIDVAPCVGSRYCFLTLLIWSIINTPPEGELAVDIKEKFYSCIALLHSWSVISS